jgi:hypothetical protein
MMAGDTISGSHLSTVTLNFGPTQNPATVTSGATVAASGIALVADPGTVWTITNYGTIKGSGATGIGIVLDYSETSPALNGGLIFNRSTGTIYGSDHGVELEHGGTVFNQGSISAGSNGFDPGAIYTDSGGSVTNQSGGVISAANNGIIGVGAYAVTVANQGTVTAGSKGIYIDTGGSVTNQSGGVIHAGGNGIELLVANASYGDSVTNLSGGTILAGNYGILLGGGGYLTNQAGGRISGSVTGVVAYGGAVTLLNAGTIAGSGPAGYAVGLAAGYADRLIADPGAVFIGTVSGGNTIGAAYVSTLELASGAYTGTMSGLGSRYIDFAQIVVDPGASWLLGGGNTLAAGITLTNGGTLGVLESLVNYGQIAGSVTLGVGAVLTNASGGTIASSGVAAVYGANSGSNTLVNAGGIGNSAGYGVSFGAGGTVTNASGGTIAGYRSGVYIAVAAGTVVNDGSISGGQVAAVVLDEGGQVTNQSGGTITGYSFGRGVGIYDAAGTVINFGSIASSSGYAVYLDNGGTVTNQTGGTITGYAGAGGVAIRNAPGTVINFGSVASFGGSAIYVFNSGYVTNQSGGIVNGQNAGVILGTTGTIVNDGSISGNNAAYAGVVLKGGGQITNQGGGTIIGYAGADGVNIDNAAGTVENAGTISGTPDAVQFAAGYADRLIIDPGAVFYGIVDGGNSPGAVAVSTLELASGVSAGTLSGLGTQFIDFGQITVDPGASWVVAGSNVIGAGVTLTDDGTLIIAGSLVNSGALTGPLTLGAGGYLYNTYGGTIAGSGVAAVQATGLATVLNAGLIDPADYGVYLAAGGTVTNVGGGTIVGTAAGVKISGAPGTVINSGSIYGSGANGSGVELVSGGTVANQYGGTIGGTLYGVQSSNAATVTNSGTIGAGAVVGVGLAFGQVTNAATGTIAGTSSGIRIYGGGTVVDAGAIYGGGDAVHFYAGSTASLVIDPGAVFGGTVDGGNAAGAAAVSTLELASASAPGALSGFGSQFVDFAQVTVDAGAQWTLDPTDTFGSGVTLTNAGTLTGSVTLAAGGELSNAASGSVSGYDGVYGTSLAAVAVVNAGSIAGYTTGAFGAGIVLLAGGSVTNQIGGAISGYQGVYGGYYGPMTVVNAGSITAAYGDGVILLSGGSVTNQSGGAITGYQGIIGGTAAALIVVNAGSIEAYAGEGVFLAGGGSVTNLTGGAIVGYGGVFASYVAATVVNAGSIVAYYFAGVDLFAGGSVTNQSGGSIVGYDGIYGSGALTVVNAGSITATGGHGGGVILGAGGNVTNQASAAIGGYNGIVGNHLPATVVNAGTVVAYGAYGLGIALRDGGSVTNQSGGTISGYAGIYARGAPLTVVNAGSIVGNTTNLYGTGVVLLAGGGITNQSGGYIKGNSGVYGGKYDALTVVNAGTITGTYASVQFTAGYADQVVFYPGAVFTGLVDGGNTIGGTAVSTLELAGGATVGTLSGVGTQFVDFVQTTIDAGASWILGGGNYFAAGTTLVNAGTLTVLDTTLSDAGLVINNGTILIDPSTMNLTDLTGTGTVVIDSGSTLDVLGSVTTGETIVFGTGSDLLGVNPTAFAGQIDGFAFGGTIELTGVSDGYAPLVVNGNTLEIQRASHPAVDLTLDPGVDYTGQVFAISAIGAITDQTPCFLHGTMIRTERGETKVQDLAVGDRVLTLSGRSRPVTWIGTGRVMIRRGRRCAATPVIVRKGALADNVPHADLRITKGHSLFVDGVLIPAEFLVNHRSILWDDHNQTVAFYHIELETHDVLIANGAACESYRDDGNRWLFGNANSGWSQPPQRPCAPVLTGGPVVDAIWRRLLDRAGPRPGVPLTEDPDLHLLVDEVRVDAGLRHGTAYEFRFVGGAKTVRIVSRAAAPAELGVARDPRSLGVAVTRIAVSKAARLRVMEADDPALTDGFHAFEPALRLRWTDGGAALPAALFDGFDGTVELVLHLGGSTRYPAFVAAGGQVAA